MTWSTPFTDDASRWSTTLDSWGGDWGFRLVDVKVPVRWWHGDTDHVVPIDGVHTAISRLQDADLVIRSGESHLGGFAIIDDVLEYMRSQLSTEGTESVQSG